MCSFLFANNVDTIEVINVGFDRGHSHVVTGVSSKFAAVCSSSKCFLTAQARANRMAGALLDCVLIVVPCTFFRFGGHFSWQAQENPRVFVVSSRLFVAGAGDIGTNFDV